MKSKEFLINKKPNLTLLILKTIFDIGGTTIDSFFPAKYPQARLWRGILGLDSEYKFSKPTFSMILWRLQKQGLVERKKNKWFITAIGKNFINKNRFSKTNELPPRDGIMRLVIFDVPERYRKKRLWLRLELTGCDYKLLQKSVWIGFRPLPREFIDGIEYLNLRDTVHIFSVKHSGTLEEK